MAYIEREALLECEHRMIAMDGCYQMAVLSSDVRNIPAADVAPVRHGRWDLECSIVQCYTASVVGLCSECRNSLGEIWRGIFPQIPHDIARATAIEYAKHQNFSHYCSNCGARMDGEEAGHG